MVNYSHERTYDIEFPVAMTVTGTWEPPEPCIGINTWGFAISRCSLPSYLEDEDWIIKTQAHIESTFSHPGEPS